MRLLYVEYGDLCGFNVCYMLETGRCGFYIRGTEIFALVSEYTRNVLKFNGVQALKIALESVCMTSRTWVGYEQRFSL